MQLPDPALQERFLRDWYAATDSGCADRALVAISGGADSSALLLLMASLGGKVNPPRAATVDHGIRPASSAEAGVAADLCRAVGIEHSILSGPLPERVAGTANLSTRARDLRYRLLEEHADAVGARWIVTAHHADDQRETLVMRLNRGAGVRGLSGIRSRSDRVVRPLIGWRREELAAMAAACGVVAVNDPSNVDDRFDRARLRKVLATADWLDALAMTRSAAACADADEAIEWMADRLEAEHCQYGTDQAIVRPTFLPAELKRRLVERALRRVDPRIEPRGGDLSRLILALDSGGAATLGQVACSVAMGRHEGLPDELWVFRPAPPRRSRDSAH